MGKKFNHQIVAHSQTQHTAGSCISMPSACEWKQLRRQSNAMALARMMKSVVAQTNVLDLPTKPSTLSIVSVNFLTVKHNFVFVRLSGVDGIWLGCLSIQMMKQIDKGCSACKTLAYTRYLTLAYSAVRPSAEMSQTTKVCCLLSFNHFY